MGSERLGRWLSVARSCPVCGAPCAPLRRRCPACGFAKRLSTGEAAFAAGTLLLERYAVGGPAVPPHIGTGAVCWGYDRLERRHVWLAAYVVPPEARGAYLARFAALAGLEGCAAVAVPSALVAAGDLLVAVTPAPVDTLAAAREPMGDAPLQALLQRLTDALLVLHSLEHMDRSVIRIINGHHTGRQAGAPITDLALAMLSRIEEENRDGYISYFCRNKKGEPLKAATITHRARAK